MSKSSLPSKTRISFSVPTKTRLSLTDVEEMVYDDPEQCAQQIIRIARKPQLMRSDYETQILKNSLRNIKFFREQFDAHYEDMLEDVCDHARLVMMTKGDTVFLQETQGDSFYIIVKGAVKIVKKVSYQMGQVKNKKGVMVDHYVDQTKLLVTLNNGDSFGELALLENKPRAATALCETDCYFLVLDKYAFSRIIATKAKRQFMHLLEKLRENSILRELSNNTVKALFMVMERVQFQYGDYVYRQQEPSEALYFVSQGEFRLQQETIQTEMSEDLELLQRKGRKQLFDLKIAGSNECIGLEDFIDGGAHTSQAICHSQEGILFKLDRVDYHRLEQRYPDICQIMVDVAKEKATYYADLSQQVAQVKKSVTQPHGGGQSSESTKHIRKIITEDQEMSFIYRDQITLNEDNDIVMKFSRFFQIEAVTQPFQVNTVEQIQKHRIQSSGYRTLASSTHIPHVPTRPQARCGSAIPQMTAANSPQPKPRRIVKSRSKKEAIQEKVQGFLQLNLDKIIVQSKDLLSFRRKQKQSKPYIRPYRDRKIPLEQSQVQSETGHLMTIQSPDKTYFAPTSSRPQTGKKPLLCHDVSPISHTRKSHKTPQQSFRGNSATNDTIHNYHEKSGASRFHKKLNDTMSVVQVPLKYHSNMLKAGSLCRFGFKNSKPSHHVKSRNLIDRYFDEQQ